MPKNPIRKRKDGRYRYRVTDAQGKRLELTSGVGERRKDFALRCDALDQKSEEGSFDQNFDGFLLCGSPPMWNSPVPPPTAK